MSVRLTMASVVVGISLSVASSPMAVAQENKAKAAAPTVMVAEITEQSVPIYREYTGTTAAVKSIMLQAQVTGYLLERRFTEGADVALGYTLYVIDQRPFQAVLAQRQAELKEQQAILAYAGTTEKRYSKAARAGAAPREELDQAIELRAKTQAAIGVYEAEINQAQINLDFTEIQAPFAGRIGHTLVNIGALVKANDTALASLVQLDPIYVYFNPPETDLLLIEERQAASPLKVSVTLPHAASKTFDGTLTFIGNAADPKTGTILMRATLANADQRIRPGQFAVVRLHIADQPNALVVPAKAISSIQNKRFVMVVGKNDTVEKRAVRLGPQVGNDAFVVEAGLKKGERVVVSDTQMLKPGATVSPKRPSSS